MQLHSTEQLLDKIAYVHHNPLHHDSSPFYDFWHFSSYKNYLSQQSTKLKRQEGLTLFGGEEAFIIYHDDFDKNWHQTHGHKSYDDGMDV